MNRKLMKYREKFQKNTEEIAVLTEENKKLAPMIRELENREIVGLVRGHDMTPEELEELLGPLMRENEKLKVAVNAADADDENTDDDTIQEETE